MPWTEQLSAREGKGGLEKLGPWRARQARTRAFVDRMTRLEQQKQQKGPECSLVRATLE